MATRPMLRKLADRFGILPGYLDILGRRRQTSDATRERLLEAMGVRASSEAEAARALAADVEREATTILDPACVLREWRSRAFNLRIAPPGHATGMVTYRLEFEEESGKIHARDGQGRARKGALRVALPIIPRSGYHRLRVWVREGSTERRAEQVLIVTPGRCATLHEVLRGRRVFGLLANLYSVRSRGNWGVGDLSDAKRLIAWGARIGAAFVGVNPLHALRNRGVDVSPYSPVSRIFRNPIYLDVTAVPELGQAPAARAHLSSPDVQAEIARLREADRVDYGRVMALKGEALRALHAVFVAEHRGRETPRGRAYARFLETEGDALTDFATWCALDERFQGKPAPGWRAWPEEFRDPGSAAVRRFREEREQEVDFHRYLQFELDRQLAAVAEAARGSGLPLGIYQDLALGTSDGGADPWAFRQLFVRGATLGAPPDDYAAQGQDWGLPPLDPRRLLASGYAYYRRVLRAGLAHAGALRIDHVMGLFRQFWIPAGRPAAEGAYVRYPADDLLGILALESARAQAPIVGEDLGTVPRGLSGVLARWGILSSRVFYFQRTRRGTVLPPSAYPERSVATAGTHDLPPLEGFFVERDLELLRAAGSIPDDRSLAAARARRRRDVRAIVRRLRAEKLLAPGEAPTGAARRALVHALLSRAPSRLLGVALDDLAGEEEPVNLPGVPQSRHPSWTRRMGRSIEALRDDSGAEEILAVLDSRAARKGAKPRPGGALAPTGASR